MQYRAFFDEVEPIVLYDPLAGNYWGQLLGPGSLFPESEAKQIVLDGRAALDL